MVQEKAVDIEEVKRKTNELWKWVDPYEGRSEMTEMSVLRTTTPRGASLSWETKRTGTSPRGRREKRLRSCKGSRASNARTRYRVRGHCEGRVGLSICAGFFGLRASGLLFSGRTFGFLNKYKRPVAVVFYLYLLTFSNHHLFDNIYNYMG
ncbi:hypothetical protein BC937DRAFT_89650 [Endogone sp. FLAS-F59071]|nr:hypothetical protein BC937DRAFT_89650 [Endogone sp. FLAS-F59071]|eukprot:RUS22321.1 hypothetical protein BC937DRAFT_89650 [Endogone sp. FLAS-F59071]